MKKEDKIMTFTKYIVSQFYHITCFTCFYGHVSLGVSLLLISHHPTFHGKISF